MNNKNEEILKKGETKHKRPWEEYDYEVPEWEKNEWRKVWVDGLPYKSWK